MALPSPPTYHRLRVSVRPPRIATLILGGDGWEVHALRMLENFSRWWGGAANVLVPWNDGQVPEFFWRYLETYDPDIISYYTTTFRGNRMANPDGFERWLTAEAERVAREGSHDAEEARGLILDSHVMTQSQTAPPSEAVKEELLRRTAPLARGGRLLMEPFHADDEPGRFGVDMARVSFTDNQLPIAFTLDDLPMDLRLLAAGRFGALAPGFVEKLREFRVSRKEIPLDETRARGLLDLCWNFRTGQSYLPQEIADALSSAGWSLPMPSPDQLFDLAPLGRTEVGCAWLEPMQWFSGKPLPHVVVAGQQVEDFCLYLILERLYGRAAWLPPTLPSVEGDERQIQPTDLMAMKLETSAVYGEEDRDLLITSFSLDEAQVTDLARTIESSKYQTSLSGKLLHVSPDHIPLPLPRRLLHRVHYDKPRSEPFVNDQQVGGLETPIPDDIATLDPKPIVWFVDCMIGDIRLPPRHCLSEAVVAGESTFERHGVRNGADGVSFFSQSQGFIYSGSPIERTLAKPRLRLPPPEEVFRRLMEAGELRGAPSSSGRFTQRSIDLWGGLDEMASDLSAPNRFALLRSFLSTEESHEDTGIMLDRRYLDFDQLGRASSLPDRDLRSLLDSYLSRGILSRGLILQCSRCAFSSWYSIEAIGQEFRCGRCRNVDLIRQPHWKKPLKEPLWYYQLDEVVFQALSHNVQVPVLALKQLKESCVSFLSSVEMDVARDSEHLAEIDILAICDGRIVIGEAKSVDALEGTAGEENQTLAKLGAVAEALSAHKVVFASSTRWQPATRQRIEQFFQGRSLGFELLEDLQILPSEPTN